MERKLEHQIQDGGLDAKIFLPKEEVDLETMKQIRKMITHHGIKHPRIMPDCHKGNGCCVGFTSILEDTIVPNYVGGDIGCGILTYNVGDLTYNKKEKRLARIDKIVRAAIPMGIKDFCIHPEPIVTKRDFNVLCTLAQEDAVHFALKYKEKYGVSIGELMPKYSEEWLRDFCIRAKADYKHVMKSLGTLGGGNHFIEFNEDQRGNTYITIHTGSRNFGQKVCRYHQDKINKHCKFDFDFFDTEMKKARRKYKNPKLLKEAEDEIRTEIEENRHEKYLQGEEAYSYYFDMIFAQKYAQLNRRLILRTIMEHLGLNQMFCHGECECDDCVGYLGFDEEQIIESVHNYIDFKDFILRKGSISAYPGKKCIVSLNMRDGILICHGKGNEDWNYSSAHGAGRMINRNRAQSRLRMKEFIKEMENVYSTSIVPETLDESPMAYKDTDLIKAALEPSVDIIEQLKPVINIKATS